VIVGFILLEGGAEFGGDMALPDRRALELAGGLDARISIIPTAAAPDNNQQRAGQNGVTWFQSLGATDITVLPLVDNTSANDPVKSAAWQAMLKAFNAGAIIAGSSAGAMVLCEYYYHPTADEVVEGLGLIDGACVIPHHDTFGKSWVKRLTHLLPETVLIGIDEETGMLNDGPDGMWQIYGKGAVTLYQGQMSQCFTSGEPFHFI
jgi:cyanophycinase